MNSLCRLDCRIFIHDIIVFHALHVWEKNQIDLISVKHLWQNVPPKIVVQFMRIFSLVSISVLASILMCRSVVNWNVCVDLVEIPINLCLDLRKMQNFYFIYYGEWTKWHIKTPNFHTPKTEKQRTYHPFGPFVSFWYRRAFFFGLWWFR